MTKLFAHDADFDGKKVVAHDGKIPLQVAYDTRVPEGRQTPNGPDSVPLAVIWQTPKEDHFSLGI
jgi:hypothetical protein